MGEGSELEKIPHEIIKEAYKVGIEEEETRSGTLFHVDQSTVYSKVNEKFGGKLELMDTKEALEKYDWVKDYLWNLIDKEKDEFTEKVSEEFGGGYFMRILPNQEIMFPLQSCLLMRKQNQEQKVHNIIIAEENSKAHIISGCTQSHGVTKGSHLGVTEYYIKKNAELNFTMIHDWGEETFVRPRSAALIEDKGSFTSNYVNLEPVKDVQMYPEAYCNGKESKVSFNNILYSQKNSNLDIGSKAVLNGKESRAEMISRAIVQDGAKIIVRGEIDGNNSECKGHLECRGLIMDNDSIIRSIPELVARKKGADITHEAAVGKISEKQIEYLMTRGIPRDRAISLITRGFMDVRILGLPEELNKEVNKILDMALEKK